MALVPQAGRKPRWARRPPIDPCGGRLRALPQLMSVVPFALPAAAASVEGKASPMQRTTHMVPIRVRFPPSESSLMVSEARQRRAYAYGLTLPVSLECYRVVFKGEGLPPSFGTVWGF